MLHIAVGSNNPTKLDAVRLGFIQAFATDVEVYGFGVESGVPDQPLNDAEALRGARARAAGARDGFTEMHGEPPDYYVGIEGTLMQVVDYAANPAIQTFDCGWIVVFDREGRNNAGSTIRMVVPDPILKYIDAGDELGTALDKHTGLTNTKQKQGHFGLATDNMLTRTSAYRDGVISALSMWIAPEYFS